MMRFRFDAFSALWWWIRTVCVPSASSISLSQFHGILRTEAPLLLPEDAFLAQTDPGLAYGLTDHTSGAAVPGLEGSKRRAYLACDTRTELTGPERRRRAEDFFGSGSLVPLYNKRDMSCYGARTTRETAARARVGGYDVLAFAASMKIASGTLDEIEAGTSAYDVSLWPDVDVAPEAVAEEIVRHAASHLVRACRHILASSGVGLVYFSWTYGRRTLMLRWNDQMPRDASCLRQFIETAVAPNSQVQLVSPVLHVRSFNTKAQWIVQSGTVDERPFWDADLTGRGQIAAVSDTGLDLKSCYFKHRGVGWGRYRHGAVVAHARKVVQYVDHVDFEDAVNGHGSHVCGILAGAQAKDGRTESVGAGVPHGIAKGAKIAFFDIGDAAGYLHVPTDEVGLEKMMSYGFDAGARVHNVSWGAAFNNEYAAFSRFFDDYIFNHHDFLVVVAAGNYGRACRKGYDCPNSTVTPGTSKNVLTVGASGTYAGNYNSLNYLSDFSSRGPSSDGRRKPDVVATGSLRSVAAQKSHACRIVLKEGTSMAAPVVSGAALLVRQYFQEGFYPTGTAVAGDAIDPSGVLVKAVLINGARPLLGIQNQKDGISDTVPYDDHQGFGRVSLIDSLFLRGKNNFRVYAEDQATIFSRSTHAYRVKIRPTEGCDRTEFRVTLAWADQAGALYCASCMLNDLDLVVRKNDGPALHPNGRASKDGVNNVEQVRVAVQEDDVLHVQVYAEILEEEALRYSLVMSGCFETAESFRAGPTSRGVPSSAPSLQPSFEPSFVSTARSSDVPTSQPSKLSSMQPSKQPSTQPFSQPSNQPSIQPSIQPSVEPSIQPSIHPSIQPSIQPSIEPSIQPSMQPSLKPSTEPSIEPSHQPSPQPSFTLSSQPSVTPSSIPSFGPSIEPSFYMTSISFSKPSVGPSFQSSIEPSTLPSFQASNEPSIQPSSQPSGKLSIAPTLQPIMSPSSHSCADDLTFKKVFQRGSVLQGCNYLMKRGLQWRLKACQRAHQGQKVLDFCPRSCETCPLSAQPSSQPSGEPSVAPTAQPVTPPSSHSCVDDPSFKKVFQRGHAPRGCDYLTKRGPQWRLDACKRGHMGKQVLDFCPHSCDVCPPERQGCHDLPGCVQKMPPFPSNEGLYNACHAPGRWPGSRVYDDCPVMCLRCREEFPSNCCRSVDQTGCANSRCEALVCRFDQYCCNNRWDLYCVKAAEIFCGTLCSSGIFTMSMSIPSVPNRNTLP